jgi:endonuclease G
MLQKLLAPLVILSSLLSLGACDKGATQQSHSRAPTGILADRAPARESCADHYLDGRAPRIENPKLAADTRELCFKVFSVMHSGKTRTPLWSAEHLEAHEIDSARQLTRENSFHAEQRLPTAQRAELDDYARQGYDRGHMAPNGDMPDRESQRDSFSLANIVPQDGENNRHLWAGIEDKVRKMALKEGDLYVVTGPAYVDTGNGFAKAGRVIVPNYLYKLVYSPRQKAGAAWWVENTADAKPTVISIPELEQKIGINLLPALSEDEKARMLQLPNIRQKKGDRRKQ